MAPARRELARVPPPVIDACLFITLQHLVDGLGDLGGAGRVGPQQFRENRAHLGRGDGRGFSPPTADARFARTTVPARTASYGDASPPNCTLRSGSSQLLDCLARIAPRCGVGS